MSTTIESLELEIVSNSQSAAKGIDSLIESLTKLKGATKGLGLKGVANEMGEIGNATKKVKDSDDKASRSFTDLYHKMSVGINTIKKVSKVISSAVKKSMDYTENMNLFSVSMGQYASGALEYAEKVSDTLGIDTSEWIRAQGVFMTLATGFGVASDRANTMSKNLTQLGYDLASFYNLSTDDAMQKLQSGMSGELEPLRRLGYDLSQAKLEATALELGINKSVSAMTQAEKAQLRYYAIMTQVTQTHGDMARTLDDPANQMRVFKAQCSMAAREIGNVFIPALNAIIPYGIALAKVIGTIASSIAGLFGFEKSGVEETTSKVVENTDSVTENLGDAQEEAKKLKSYMLGIDELNVINPNTDSETEDLSGTLDFDLPEYDFLASAIESKVNIIVEEMKEWLGITDDIDSWAELLDTRFGDILETVGLIGLSIAGWKIVTTTSSVLTALSALLANPVSAIAISVILTVVGIKTFVNGIKDALERGLDGFNFGEILAGSLLTASAAAIFGSKLATFITTAFSSSAVSTALTSVAIKWFGASGPITAGAVAGAGGLVAACTVAIIAGIGMMFVGIRDAITGELDWLNGILTAGGATLIGAGIGAFFGPLGMLIGAAIGLVVGLITDLVIFIVQKWDKISAWLDTNVVRPMKTFFKPLTDACAEAWQWLVENLFVPFGEAFTEVKDYAIGKFTEIRDGVVTAFTVIKDKVVEIKNKIVEIFTALKWAFDEYVWNPLKEKVSAFYNEHIKPIVDTVKEAAQEIWNAFKEKVLDKIKTKIDELVEDFKKFGKGAADLISGIFKGVINGILTLIENRINGFIRLLNGAIWIINKIPGVSITQIAELSIPRLAEGGFPDQGQMFIAREAGAEMVGTIGRKTAVANNDQIVSGIAGGVAEANEEQNTLLREQNSLLRAILDKDSSVYLDGRNLANSVEKYQRERGRVLIAGGVV